jgi:hypothetical protein
MIGAAAAAVLVVAAMLAWRMDLLPWSGAGTNTDPRVRTAGIPPTGQPVGATPVSPDSTSSQSTNSRPVEQPASGKPAQSASAPPPARAPTSSFVPAKAGAVPDVRGKTILEAREILRNAGFRFFIRLRDDRSQPPGIVESQALDELTAPSQVRRVLLSAVAASSVVIHVAKGDERKADDLVAHLRDQPSTIGSIVRGQSAVPRPELVGQVGYSENRLAAQAEAIAKDASEYLARTGNPRTLQATLRPRIVDRTIIVGLYERAQ